MLPYALTMCKNFTGQNFYPTNFSPVIFSPLVLTGEIGENLPLAKISRYTVVLFCKYCTMGPLYCGHFGDLVRCPFIERCPHFRGKFSIEVVYLGHGKASVFFQCSSITQLFET